MKKLKNYIDGQLIAPNTGTYLDNYNPAEGSVYSLIPDSDTQDVEKAIAAAKTAFPLWSALSTEKRSSYLLKIAEGIEKRLEDLAKWESIDSGKPLKLAKEMDIPRAAANFRFFATAILHDESPAYISPDKGINYTLRKPIGIAACISPWNLPLYLFSWKIAPALASGNCVIAKPSELSPMTAYLLSEICIEVGLPKGVLNIIHGLGGKAGQAMVEHEEIKAISFTGGTQTGKRIAATAAPMFKKLSLELGGKNPNIVFADCQFDLAVETSVKAAFSNQGQICLCGSRIFVEESIYEAFREAFVKKVKALKIGNPLKEDSNMGALISESHKKKVLSYIELAKAEGGKLLCGGHEVQLPVPNDKGYFVALTVFEDLPFDCRTNQEEIFGPVVTLMPFKTEEEVLNYANSTPYGLSATIWTENLNRAHRLADQIDSGIVWVNCWLVRDLRTPFGGMKQSGVGREGGFEALHFFTEPKTVCIKQS